MSLRLFAALDIPDDAAERLMAIMRGVPGADWRPRSNLHLTLRFFGEVNERVADDLDMELAGVAERFPCFDLALGGAGFFGKAEPHALWVAAKVNKPLLDLAKACERAARRAGLAPETRNYAPHVTLAYLRGTDPERVHAFEQRYALFSTPSWRVERFALYSSWQRPNEASIYREEADYPLGG